MRTLRLSALAAGFVAVLTMSQGLAFGQNYYINPTGILETTGANGGWIDYTNPFFAPLGTNGRTCASCHNPATAWGTSTADLQFRFLISGGTDPIFRTVDGANSPNANVSTESARLSAYSMLLNRGTIRVGLPIPSYGEFTLTGVQDPYNFASAAQLSLFRKPLPATNLRFLSTVMWDGRFSFVPFGGSTVTIGAPAATNNQALFNNLVNQANNAVFTHSQGPAQTNPSILASIVNFELSTTTAQIFDNSAGFLNFFGANGGPSYLSKVPFYIAINDVIGRDPTGAKFNPASMTMYNAWTNFFLPAQASVARGEVVFLTPFNITGVAGLNDALNVPVLLGSCVACHDTPNVGNQSTELYFNSGVVAASRRTPDMPLYTLTNKTTGATMQVTDPGRALVTGSWAGIGKFKPPVLRGLAGRPPFFHDGSASSLTDVVKFYNTRFNINYTPQQIADLTAFLQSL